MPEFETYLKTTLDQVKQSEVKDAMMYSLLAGGKRIRPQLLFACLKAYGKEESIGYPFAAAIEMVHTYSLIHDDLPAMDDDTLRRGQPTVHVKFNEATAILAGDALLTQAFLQASDASDDPIKTVELIRLLASYAGADGMVLGQIKDLKGEAKASLTIDELKDVHFYKTSKLITLPLLGGAILSERKADMETWIRIGKYIGLSFQIQDDVLDITSSDEILGKNVNSDANNHKVTYVSLQGIEQAQKSAAMYYQKAWDLLSSLDIDVNYMEPVFKSLIKRSN